MFPNITLKIENHIPKIIYFPEEGMSRVLTTEDENLETLIVTIGKDLNLDKEFNQDLYIELIHLATEGDERFIEDIPAITTENRFNLEEIITSELEKAKANRSTFSEYGELTEEVRNELERNQNLDIFASLLEMIYNILIAKTIRHASDLGIGNLVLDDKNGNLRLREKMASELSKIDIELQFAD